MLCIKLKVCIGEFFSDCNKNVNKSNRLTKNAPYHYETFSKLKTGCCDYNFTLIIITNIIKKINCAIAGFLSLSNS